MSKKDKSYWSVLESIRDIIKAEFRGDLEMASWLWTDLKKRAERSAAPFFSKLLLTTLAAYLIANGLHILFD